MSDADIIKDIVIEPSISQEIINTEGESVLNGESNSSSMATISGTIEPFVIGEDFGLYKLRLEYFISLNKIVDDKAKIDILASFGGADLFKTLHSLIQPRSIEGEKCDDLIRKLTEHFEPKKNIVAESFKFYKREQKSSKSISEYIVELKSMAQECDFNDFLDRALRDRFICGVHNSAIQQRLLNDGIDTFEKACGIALTMESKKTNLDIIHGGADSATNFIDRKQFDHKKNGNNSNNSSNKSSYSQHHKASYQRSHGGFRNQQHGERSFTCFLCGKPGHIAKFCNRGRHNTMNQRNVGKQHNDNEKTYTKSVHNLNENISNSFDYQYLNVLHSMFINRSNESKIGALTTLVEINGGVVRMEFDSGASGTVMSIGRFNELFPG